MPYIKGVPEQIRRVFKPYDVLSNFKPMNTICQLLVRLKDKIVGRGKERVVGPVYHIPCDSRDASYIGEKESMFFLSIEDPPPFCVMTYTYRQSGI